MTMKPFDIQESTLKMGGVQLEAGNTGVVIPGVTQAASYTVEKVDDTGDQTHTFTPSSEVVVIDAEMYNAIVNQNSEQGFADFTASTDDEGYIDDIEVNGAGTYDPMSASVNSSTDMYAYIGSGSASDRPLVPQDWIQIPFRPKMRAGEIETIGGSGSGNQLVNTDSGDTLAVMDTGDVILDGEGPGGVDRGLVWKYGENHNGINSMIRQDEDGLTVRAWTENGDGNYSAPVRIVTNQDMNQKTWTFDSNGGLTFPDNTVQTTAATGSGSSLSPQLTKVEDEILLTGTLHLGQASGGSISELDSEGNINFWFNSATGDLAGRKYAVGSDNNGTAFLVCFGLDGAAVWSWTFDQIDFGGSIGLQTVYPFVVKHWTDTNNNNSEYIYVGFDSSSYIGVAKFAIDGTKVSHWVYTHSEDPNLASFDQHDMVIDPANGNFTIVGRMYGEWIAYDLVSAQPGTDGGVLVVNRADLNNAVNIGPYDTTDWRVDIDGNGNWYEPSNGGINAFFNLGLYSVSDNGGQQIYVDPQHYSTGGIVVDATGTPFLKIYSALWTNTAKRDFLLSLGAGQQYNFVCAPGSLYTFTASDVWTADGSDWTLQGSFAQVTGDSLSTVVNITNINFNQTAVGTLRYYIDSNGISYADGFNIAVPGSGYTSGEQVKILGSLLGGVDGGYITSLNSLATPVSNTWLFAKNDYPTLGADAPAGTFIRQGWTGAIGTVVSVTDNGQDQWEVVLTVSKGTPATGGSVEFFAGNDCTGQYYPEWQSFNVSNWLPVQDVVRFNMDQMLSELPEYNIKQSSGDQAFIYSPNFYHTVGGNGNQGFTSVTLDSDNSIVYAMGDFNIPNSADTAIVAFDYTNGDILWQKNVTDTMDWGRAHGIAAGNNSLFVPWENDDGDFIVTKISKDGDHLWSIRQIELNNWDNAPQPLIDSNGDLLLVGAMNLYNQLQDSWNQEIAVVKLSQTDGALLFANSLTRLTARTSVYEYNDSDASPCSIVNDKIFYGGYMSDRNNNYNVGVAVSIPANGSGVGSNGDWEYHAIPFTNNPVFVDYTNDVTLNTQNIPHPDALQITSTELSVTGNTIESIPVLVRNEIIGGASKFTFEDGGEIGQTGIQRHAAYNGNNTITLSADMNGKFLYFANNPDSFNSTIFLPLNASVALPIGFTVTVVMGDFNGCSVYVNNDGNGDVKILVNGNSDMNTWYWGFGGDGNAGVYTIMKVDTNTWMLAGPNVWVD